MKYFRKSINSGNLTATLPAGAEINSQPVSGKCTLRPGDVVRCDPAALGKSGIKSFEEIESPKGLKRSVLKAEIARLETILRLKSAWLNPSYQAGVGEFIYIPSDSKGLSDILATLEDESFNASGQATGALSAGKLRLKAVWDSWKYQVEKVNPYGTKKLKEPTGDYLSAIALAEAQVGILKGEISEVRRRLSAALEDEAGQAGARVEKLRFKGHGRLKNGMFVSMDARQVHYVDGKPVFVDNGQTIEDYKLEIKKHKAELAKKRAAKEAKEAKSRRELAEATV